MRKAPPQKEAPRTMAALRAAALTAVFAYGVGSFEVGTEQLRFEVSNSSQVPRCPLGLAPRPRRPSPAAGYM